MDNFFNFLARLQEEPEAKRRRIAFSGAVILTVIIFGIWLSLFKLSIFRNSQVVTEKTAVAVKPAAAVLGDARGFWSGFQDLFAGLLDFGKVSYERPVSQTNTNGPSTGKPNTEENQGSGQLTASTTPTNYPAGISPNPSGGAPVF